MFHRTLILVFGVILAIVVVKYWFKKPAESFFYVPTTTEGAEEFEKLVQANKIQIDPTDPDDPIKIVKELSTWERSVVDAGREIFKIMSNRTTTTSESKDVPVPDSDGPECVSREKIKELLEMRQLRADGSDQSGCRDDPTRSFSYKCPEGVTCRGRNLAPQK
jgi:hypothetical protein